MDRSTFLITVFCLIDDWLTGQRVRARGPLPTLYDSEVLTIEVVGAFCRRRNASGSPVIVILVAKSVAREGG